jgi:hypothetical protein
VRLIKENNKLTINYTVPIKLEKITLGFEKNTTPFTWEVIIQSLGKIKGKNIITTNYTFKQNTENNIRLANQA